MKPLIDCDVLRYEIGACGQHTNEEGELVTRSFDFVQELFDEKIREICALVWATEEPLLFLTVDAGTKRILNRPKKKELKKLEQAAMPEQMKFEHISTLKEEMEYKPNFREKVAITKPYKGNRKNAKPYHFDNLTAYILGNYDTVTAEGFEADDLLAIHQEASERVPATKGTTIICTRDKDLRQVSGMHFGWACGKQSAFGPELVSDIGRLQPIYDHSNPERIKDVKGTGLSFFCLQLLTGDTVDNIAGVPRIGHVKAFAILNGLTTYEDMLKAVREAYRVVYGDEWDTHMLEQGRLLWMCRELKDGKPVMWELPEWLYEDETD